MEPPSAGAAFNWRDRLGIVLAIAAGLLLFIVGLRIYGLGHETDGDVTTLNNEHSAVAFLKKLQKLNTAFQDYRMAVVLDGPGASQSLAKRADAALSDAARFEKPGDSAFDVTAEWKDTRSAWAVFRAHPAIDNDAAVLGAALS